MIYLFSNIGDAYIEHFFLKDSQYVLFATIYNQSPTKEYLLYNSAVGVCENTPEFKYDLPDVLITYKDLSLSEFKLKVEQRKEEIIISKL